jgi:acetyltransferase-like isoleucine patch superfamily enzyme
MTRALRILVVVAVPAETTLLDADVAGRPAGSYLFERLRHDEGVEVYSSPTAPFDALSVALAADDNTAVLAVDARAWLSLRAWTQVIDEARHGAGDFRVVDSAAHSAPRTLAVCARADRRHELLTLLQRPATDGGRLSERVADGRERALDVSDLDVPPPAPFVDSYGSLAAIEHDVLLHRADDLMKQGVRVRDPRHLFVRGEVRCGIGVELDVGVILEGAVTLGNRVRVGAHVIVRDSLVGDDTWIRPFSIVEGAQIGSNGFVGPYGRIRPQTTLGDRVQIGNYVEIKNSQLGDSTCVHHHSFIGDATIGERVTIGAGTTTCNHDGANVNRTLIEAGAYVGSGCNLVAPVCIHEGAVIGAGSTITDDAPPNNLTVARSRQVTVEDWRGPRRSRP